MAKRKHKLIIINCIYDRNMLAMGMYFAILLVFCMEDDRCTK
jgi:hypothetical protein